MGVRRVVSCEEKVGSLCSGGLGEFSLEGGAQTGSGAWDGGREQGSVLGVRNDRQ